MLQVWPDGKFQACICDPTGNLDENFIKIYSRTGEGKEWRRRDKDEPGSEAIRTAAKRSPGKKRGRSLSSHSCYCELMHPSFAVAVLFFEL